MDLMKRIYKVLLPLYREEEMNREVAQEWINDARGQKTMNLIMFQKMLFRIAHSWATHIDIQEYIEVLSKVYERIIIKQVIRGESGAVEIALPRIQVEIFQEKNLTQGEEEMEWEECDSNDEHDDTYEYQHKEDPFDPTTTKRYRRKLDNEDETPNLDTRAPIMFKEEVQFYREAEEGNFKDSVKQPGDCDIVVDLLAEI